MFLAKLLRDKLINPSPVKDTGISNTTSLWAQQFLLLKDTNPDRHYCLDPDSIKIDKTVLTFQLTNHYHSFTAHLEPFEDGIINFVIRNPNNKSQFSFYDVEPKPELTPAHPYITHQTLNSLTLDFSASEHLEPSPSSSKYQAIITFQPFSLKLFTKTTHKLILEFNPNGYLNISEHIAFDLRYPTPFLWGLPERADRAPLLDTHNGPKDDPYRLHDRDHPHYKPFTKVGLYASVPYIINCYDENNRALSGVLHANSSETSVDIKKHPDGKSDIIWQHECGDIELYFIASDGLKDFFYKSAKVSGFANLPPIWALGFHLCRFGYLDEDMVHEVNDKLTESKIPCDSLTLDIDYTDGFKYFTWNTGTFPDPSTLIKKLRLNKRRLVTINDPHFKVDDYYKVYKNAVQNKFVVKSSKGETYVDNCWPGKSVWFDSINPKAQDFWASMYSYENNPHTTRDVHAWNDMTEPAVFDSNFDNMMSPNNLHTFQKNGKEKEVQHKYIHNIYGHCVAKATFKGMIERDAPNKYRPFVLCRSFFIGTQKYSCTWSGDTGGKWSDFAAQIPLLLNNNVSGMSFCGGDVGGFFDDPSQELAVRWYQCGVWMPYFRAHSDIGTKRREPYQYNMQYGKTIVGVIRDRYKFLYYWYSVFEEYVRTGYPMMRMIWMETKGKFPASPSMLMEDVEFFVGDSVYVVSLLQEFNRYVRIHPDLAGEEWFSRESGYVENTREPYFVGLENIGVFIRGGSILPLVDLPEEFQSTEDIVVRSLHLWVTLGKDEVAEGTFYDDDTESFEYQKKNYLRRQFSFKNMRLTNRATEDEQISTGVRDRNVSMITLCGTKKDIMNWNLASTNKWDLSGYSVDHKDKKHKMITFKGLNLDVKSDWTLEFISYM